MSDKTRTQMIAFVLEHIGVKAANVAAKSEDSNYAATIIDSLYSRLRKEGLVPFDDDAYPDWAQIPFAELAGPELAPAFRIGGEPLAVLMQAREHGRREIQRQVAGFRHPLPIRATYF